VEIKGKILDRTNEPLYLANITIVTGDKIDKFGTVANDKGEFYLDSDIITDNSQFRISYQGFRPQYYKASELQGKDIKLEEDLILLDDIVITPKNKPLTKQPSDIKQHLQNHKLIYAGLGGLVGILLIVTSLKKLK